MSDKLYDFIKNLVQLILPGFATLYLSLAGVWGLGYGQQVAASTAAIATFLGVLLKLSKRAYLNSDKPFDGNLIKTVNEDGTVLYTLDLKDDPETGYLDQKSMVSFKVV